MCATDKDIAAGIATASLNVWHEKSQGEKNTYLFILRLISACQQCALVNAELDTEPDIKLTAQVRHFMRHYSFQCSASCSV